MHILYTVCKYYTYDTPYSIKASHIFDIVLLYITIYGVLIAYSVQCTRRTVCTDS